MNYSPDILGKIAIISSDRDDNKKYRIIGCFSDENILSGKKEYSALIIPLKSSKDNSKYSFYLNDQSLNSLMSNPNFYPSYNPEIETYKYNRVFWIDLRELKLLSSVDNKKCKDCVKTFSHSSDEISVCSFCEIRKCLKDLAI